jgi:hypothetical protein
MDWRPTVYGRLKDVAAHDIGPTERQNDQADPAPLVRHGMWEKDLRNEGSIFKDPDQVILDEARIQQTDKWRIQNQDFIKN